MPAAQPGTSFLSNAAKTASNAFVSTASEGTQTNSARTQASFRMRLRLLHGLQSFVLRAPYVVDPLLERLAVAARLGEELWRHVQPPHAHGHAPQSRADEVPHRRLAAGIGEGDVDDGVELVAERAQGEGERAGARAGEAAVRRLLVLLLLAREARPLEKDRHRHRHAAVAAAHPPRHDEIAAALLRMARQVIGGVAAHERELQRRARLPRDRKPDQLRLQKEADERGAAVEDAEEREDVDPGDVVADDEVVAVGIVDVDTGHVPLDRQQEVEDGVVGADPSRAEPRQRENESAPQLAARQEELRKPGNEHDAAPEEGVEQEEQKDERTAQHGGSLMKRCTTTPAFAPPSSY